LSIQSKNAKKDATNGILFINNTEKASIANDQVNSLYLFYYLPHKSWTLRYLYEGKKKYYSLNEVSSEEKKGNFSITIAKNGKIIEVKYPGGDKTIELPTSLYTISNNMIAKVQIEPGSTVTVHSLSYE
jgi:hypothetical protein